MSDPDPTLSIHSIKFTQRDQKSNMTSFSVGTSDEEPLNDGADVLKYENACAVSGMYSMLSMWNAFVYI